MSLVIDNIHRDTAGKTKRVLHTLDWDAAYPSGGEPYDPAILFGLKDVKSILIESAGGLVFEFDKANKKIKAYWPTNLGDLTTLVTPIYTQSGSDIKGSANTDSENADAASLPTNGAAVAALAAVATTWAHGAITSPGVGRNVAVIIKNPTGGALDLYEGVMTFTITGTWKGAAQTETITFTNTAGNKSVGAGKFRYKYGSKPFDTVTDFTLDHVPADAIEIAAGLGSKIGLYNPLKTPLEADVLKITKNAANLAPTGIVDTTNNTVNLGTLTDNDDWEVMYQGSAYTNATAGAVDGAMAEVADGTDLSTLLDHRIMVLGN